MKRMPGGIKMVTGEEIKNARRKIGKTQERLEFAEHIIFRKQNIFQCQIMRLHQVRRWELRYMAKH